MPTFNDPINDGPMPVLGGTILHAQIADLIADVEAHQAAITTAATDFTTKTSVPTVSDTSQAVTVTGAGALTIRTNAATGLSGLSMAAGAGAAYFQTALGKRITAIHRTFMFDSAGSTNGAAVLLGAWQSLFTSAIPASPCHFVITRTSWALSFLSGGTIVPIASGAFTTPLPLNTVLTASATLDGQALRVDLPGIDGVTGRRTIRFVDPRIYSLLALLDVVEITSSSTTDCMPIILEASARSTPVPTAMDPLIGWRPADNGLVATNFDPALIVGSQPLLAGAIYDMRMPVAAGTVITNLVVDVSTAGSGLTAGSCPLELLDASGNLLSACADQATAWQTAGLCVAPLATPVTVIGDTVLNVAWRAAGTTLPSFAAGNTTATVANLNIAQPGPMRAGYGTGSGIPNPFGVSSLNSYFQFWAGAS